MYLVLHQGGANAESTYLASVVSYIHWVKIIKKQ